MHSTAILIGFGTGTASYVMDLISNSTLWCWIDPFPKYYRVWFFYAPLWISMVMVLGINIWIYHTVQRGERNAEKLHAIHHQKHGRWYFGEKNSGKNLTSVRVPKGKKMSRWSMMSLFSHSSTSSTKHVSRLSRVSFTFGHPPFSILSTEENVKSQDKQSISAHGLHAIQESIASDQISAGESVITTESTRVQQKKPDSVSEHSSQKNNEQPPTRDALKKSNSIAIRLKEMFMPHTENDPSFMFTKDDIDHSPLDEQENIFRESKDSIQRIILPERTAQRFSRKIQWRHSEFQSTNSIRSADVKFVLATVEDYPSAAKQYAATYQIGARVVLYQSIAFVVGFWTIWIFPTIRQLVLLEDPQNIFELLVLQAIFEPLQGFFNFSVYRFSHFIRLKV